MRLAPFLFLLLAACHPAPPQPPRAADFPDDMPACIGDDDCAVTRSTECCGCPGEERVVSRTELSSQQEACAGRDCGPPRDCKTPPRRRFRRVVCENGHCIGKR